MERSPLDDDEYDECELRPFVHSKTKNSWLIIGAVLEVFSDIFMAFHKLFKVSTDAALQKFTHTNEQLKFQTQASLEIEMLTSGEYNAPTTESGGSVGSGADEPSN